MKHFLMLEIDLAQVSDLDNKLAMLAKVLATVAYGQEWVQNVETRELNTTREYTQEALNTTGHDAKHDVALRLLGRLSVILKLEEREDEDGHYQPVEQPPAEFREKQRELALSLFELANGRGFNSLEAIAEDPDYGQGYVDNYMADADEVLRRQPHLLGLATREKMGLDK